jgi:hypothetical protein
MQSKLYTYQQVASTSSSPLEQIVMLYDGAIKFLMQAAEDIKKKDILAKAEHIDRALAIVNYLRDILDNEARRRGGRAARPGLRTCQPGHPARQRHPRRVLPGRAAQLAARAALGLATDRHAPEGDRAGRRLLPRGRRDAAAAGAERAAADQGLGA